MKLSESQLKEVYETLREKFLVMRSGSHGIVGITTGNEKYFPERTKIILGMPLASSDSDLSINERPKAVRVTVKKKDYRTFSLLPLCEPKTIGSLDVSYDKKKSLMEKYHTRDDQHRIPVLKTFSIHLPYYKNTLNYGEVITRLTLELYDQFLNTEKAKLEEAFAGEHFSYGFESKLGKKLSLNKSHEQNIEKRFFEFLKSFDAIEVTSCNEVPLISTYKGFENFDENLNYASYKVSFWKFPITVASKSVDENKQKVGSVEEQLICIKRAVFKKANIEFDEKACIKTLPLVSGGNGKSDKTLK
ncbi:MAG: hypothetical protein K2K31_03430 [Clostridia bacterium]|nr:hypothetical protein [Clostridia bacterium]